MPQYAAPVNLSIQIQEDLVSASGNGNLGALAAGPVAQLPSMVISNITKGFSIDYAAGQYSISSYLTCADGPTPSDGIIEFSTPLLDSSGYSFTVLPTCAAGIGLSANSGGGNITSVYDNGVDGIGATLTVDPSVLPLTADGSYVVADGDYVLVGGQDVTAQNGVYIYTLLTGVLTRDVSFDSPATMTQGSYSNVQYYENINNPLVFITSPTVTVVGTDPVVMLSSGPTGALISFGPNSFTSNVIGIVPPTPSQGFTLLFGMRDANYNTTPVWDFPPFNLGIYSVTFTVPG